MLNMPHNVNIPEEQNPRHGNHSYGISYPATYSMKTGEGMLQKSVDKLFMLTTAYLLSSLSKLNHITDKYS